MPGRGFPLDSVTSEHYYAPYHHAAALGHEPPRPQPLARPPPTPARRRPRDPREQLLGLLLLDIMTTPEHSGFEALGDDDDDDLVEIVSARPSRPASVQPRPPLSSSTGGGAARSSRRPPPPPSQDDVIDLTVEPDSPLEVRAPQPPPRLPPMRTHRHPRRTTSQRLTPPRLSRSESIMLASETSFIDLTGDDDLTSGSSSTARFASRTTTTTTTNEPPRRSNRNHQHPIILPHPDSSSSNGAAADHLVDLEFLNPRHAIQYGFASSFARGFGRTLADILSADFLTGQAPASSSSSSGLPGRLYTQRQPPPGPAQRQPSPPPREMPPLPPTRSGFTRDTVVEPDAGAEERVVVCPACEEELAYDPAAGGAAVQTTAATGTKKRKRAAGHHHFWAVKKCGHVYCADCFENRRPTKANPDGVGFAGPPGKLPHHAPHDLRCAVEGCDAKVANKTEWVGIFL
ncbi:RING finger domain [Cordyceps militaris]|uniref:RING finger domain n=1 Tax=Cordyceps militaris TaxID=73501 RepID=A0A2H4SDF1_CORMI|nr:RING finger domain [Cordyceps militaris]